MEKKDKNELRPVQDYRKLNEGTIRNSSPLPLIGQLIDKLRNARHFTKMDVRWGFNNIRIKDGDQWKAAFKTPIGLFEPMVMYFGLCNSPATFQTMMNHLFKDLIDRGVVVVYMDDILIFTEDKEEHKKLVLSVLQRLKDNDLFLKPEKCFFYQSRIEYLGLIISHNQIEMDPVKLEGVSKWPTPTKTKHVEQFLGFANFYRKFIDHYADIARPLDKLKGKKQQWEWSKEHDHAFQTLK